MKYILIIILNLIVFQSCSPQDDCHKNLKIYNNSNIDIYFYTGKSSTLLGNGPYVNETAGDFIEANSYRNSGYSTCIENSVDENGNKDTLYVWFFDSNVLENTNWETVVSENQFLEKKAFSIEELNNLNWTISYN